jgi:hypothetical protein
MKDEKGENEEKRALAKTERSDQRALFATSSISSFFAISAEFLSLAPAAPRRVRPLAKKEEMRRAASRRP